MLKDVLEKELQELELNIEAELAELEEELAGDCGIGVSGGDGLCSGECGTIKEAAM